MFNSRYVLPFIFGLLGVLIGITISNYISVKISFGAYDLFMLGSFSIGIIVILFAAVTGLRSQKDKPHALGLPIGSIRAIIALSLIVFFVFISLVFYLSIANSDPVVAIELANNVLTILGTLLIAVSAFYFGIKATEQGGKIAQDVFKQTSALSNYSLNVPEQIILEAIQKNKETWLSIYKVRDIKLGKKQVSGATYDVNCIVFITDLKTNEPTSIIIPIFINYISSDGKNWEIPTDVVFEKLSNSFSDLDKGLQRKIIKDFISKNADKLKKEFPEIQSLAAQKKMVQGIEKDFYCLTFGIIEKGSNPLNSIPPTYKHIFENVEYDIPTDVKHVGSNQSSYLISNKSPMTGVGINPKKLGFSCSRSKNNSGIGSIGLKVKKDNKFYLLSCFHVLCEPELTAGFTVYKDTNQNIVSPGIGDGKIEKTWKVKEGKLTNKIDAAIAEIQDSDLENEYPQFPGIAIKNSLELTEKHVESKYFVRMAGRTSHLLYGEVTDESATIFVPYPIGGIKLENVILTTKISAEGDSGATAFDQWFNVIGLIVSSNDQESAIIPINPILKEFNIEIA